MKLSEMNTQQLAKCLCEIAPAMERIGVDDAVGKAFASIPEKLAGGTLMKFYSSMAGTLVPVLLGTHFDDSIAIISAMTGKSEDIVRTQKSMETIRDVKDFFDKDFFDFFRSSAVKAQKE